MKRTTCILFALLGLFLLLGSACSDGKADANVDTVALQAQIDDLAKQIESSAKLAAQMSGESKESVESQVDMLTLKRKALIAKLEKAQAANPAPPVAQPAPAAEQPASPAEQPETPAPAAPSN